MKLLLRFVILFVVAAVLTFFYYKQQPPIAEIAEKSARNSVSTSIQAPKGTIHIEIAETDAARQQGLSGRASLSEDHGLLFVFPQPGSYSFWMKDMNFLLDIIWIDEQKKIIGITRDISPDTFPQTFTPPSPVRYVLEINAGKSEQFGLRHGSSLAW